MHRGIIIPVYVSIFAFIFLADCLEGQEQAVIVESRVTGSRTVIERVPRCSPCPFNTYQDIAGSGQCKPCPVNHITFITGAISVDQCTGKGIYVCL